MAPTHRAGENRGLKKSGPKTISGPLRRRILPSAAGVELEGIDSRVPIERPVGGNVLRRVVEGAVVGRVEGHRAVVAPTAQPAVLAAATRVCVSARMLRHLAERLAWRAAAIVDTRVDGGRGIAVTDGNIAQFVHGDA